MNFNEIFMKNVTCDHIKITKNQGYTLPLENTISETPQGPVLTESVQNMSLLQNFIKINS